jgi:molybdopterin converting factor small subunit
MAQVEIPTRLLGRTGGTSRIEVEGRNVRQVLRALDERFPGLVDELKATTAIAIDGEIIGQRLEDAVLERVQADSEVYFIPAVAGG